MKSIEVCFCLSIVANFAMSLKQEMIGMLYIPGLDLLLQIASEKFKHIFPSKNVASNDHLEQI